MAVKYPAAVKREYPVHLVPSTSTAQYTPTGCAGYCYRARFSFSPYPVRVQLSKASERRMSTLRHVKMIALSCWLLVYVHTRVFAADGCWTLVHVGPESEFLLIFWMFGTPGKDNRQEPPPLQAQIVTFKRS